MSESVSQFDASEDRNARSWDITFGLFTEFLTTPHGAVLDPIVEVIRSAVRRGINRSYYASQSHGRLVISRTGNTQFEPYLMISIDRKDEVICQLYVPGECGPTISREFRCLSSSVLDQIPAEL